MMNLKEKICSLRSHSGGEKLYERHIQFALSEKKKNNRILISNSAQRKENSWKIHMLTYVFGNYSLEYMWLFLWNSINKQDFFSVWFINEL